MDCRDCPYCQMYGKILCGHCPKCPDAKDLVYSSFENGMFKFSFKQILILDSSAKIYAKRFILEDNKFLDEFERFFYLGDQSENKVYSLKSMKGSFFKYFEGAGEVDESNDIYFVYQKKLINKLNIFEANIKYSQEPNIKTFSEIVKLVFNSLNQENETLNSPKENIIKKTKNNFCHVPEIYSVSVHPSNIKLGLTGKMKKGLTLFIISNSPCTRHKYNLQKVIRETTISIIFIMIVNYAREFLFSLINTKDMLDVIRYDSTPKTEILEQIYLITTTFNCFDFFGIYDQLGSFNTNIKIRGFFLSSYKDKLKSTLFHKNSALWFQEVMKNFKLKFSINIIDGMNCRYFPIFPEYMLLFLLAILAISFFFCKIGSVFTSYNRQKTEKMYYKVSQVIGIVFDFYLSANMFVYYYNLYSFCILVTFTQTVIFGFLDFALLCLRGCFIVFPLINFIENIEQKKEKKTILPNKKKRDEKLNFTNGNVYYYWTKLKNIIDVFIRISFKNLNSKPKKDVILRYRLEVIEPKAKTKRKESKCIPFTISLIYRRPILHH